MTKEADKNLKADRANLKASVLPCLTRYSEKIGMKAELKDHSAKSRRKRLGIRNAAINASELNPAPKYHAITASRINPKMRLNSVADPTTPAAFNTR